MTAKVYDHNQGNCRVVQTRWKNNFSVKTKVPVGFSNKKQELVTIEKLTLDLIIKKFTLYGWIQIKKSKDKITVARVIENQKKSITTSLTLIVTKTLSWKLILYNRIVLCSLKLFSDISLHLTASSLDSFVTKLNTCNICISNGDFNILIKQKFGNSPDLAFLDNDWEERGCIENSYMDDIRQASNIKVKECDLLIRSLTRCQPCPDYRKTLSAVMQIVKESDFDSSYIVNLLQFFI